MDYENGAFFRYTHNNSLWVLVIDPNTRSHTLTCLNRMGWGRTNCFEIKREDVVQNKLSFDAFHQHYNQGRPPEAKFVFVGYYEDLFEE